MSSCCSRRLTICLVLVEFVVVGVITVGAVALLLWLHWPERTGALSSGDGRRSDDDLAPDASVADVGRAERPSGWQTRERGLLGSREPGGGSDGGPVAPE